MKNFKIINTKQLRSVNFHNTSKMQLKIYLGDYTRNQNVKTNYCQYLINSHKTLIESLRGGGCGTSIVKPIEDKISEKINLPYEFLNKLKGNCDLLVSKGQMLLGEQSSTNSIFIALQWFHYNSEYINVCCQSKVYVKQVYELFFCNAQKLLEVLPNYIRSSGFLAYRLLLILNDLFRVVFSFQLKEKNRLLDETKKQQLISLVENARSEFEIESTQVWKTGIDYELSLIEIMLHNCNINYSEGKELFTSFIYNLAKSVCSMSIEDDLIENIIESGKYLLNAVYEKVSFPKEVYYSYYYFQTLKWRIISEIKNNQNVKKQIQQLVLGYQTYVEKSDDWIIHYCWVQLICDLLQYRVVIFKESFLPKLKNSERQEKWNSLVEKNLLKPLPQQFQGVIQLYTNYEFIDSNLKNIFKNECKIRSFELLCEALMFEKFDQKHDFWSIYINFQFKKSKAKKNQNESQMLISKLLGIDTLQNLKDLLILNFNSIQKLVNTIQQLIGNISTHKSKLNQEMHIQELETSTKELWNETIKSLYTLSEIAEKSVLIFIQLELIDEQCEKQDLKDLHSFEKIKQSKVDLDLKIQSLIQNVKSQQITCLKIELLQQSLPDIQKIDGIQFISESSGFSEVVEKIDLFIVQQKAMGQNLIKYFMDAKPKVKGEKIYLMEVLMEKKDLLSKVQSFFPQIIIEMYGGENLQDLQQNKVSSQKEIFDLQLETKKRISFFEIVKNFQRIKLWKVQCIVNRLEIIKNSQADSEKSNCSIFRRTIVNMLESQKQLLAKRSTQELRENQVQQITEEFSQNLFQSMNIIRMIYVNEKEKEAKNKAINLIVQLKQQIVKFGKDPQKINQEFQILTKTIESNLVCWNEIGQTTEKSEGNQKVIYQEISEKTQKNVQTYEKVMKHMTVELNKVLEFLTIDEEGIKTQEQCQSNTEDPLENEYYQQLNALTTQFKEQVNNRKQMIDNFFLEELQNPNQKIIEEQILYILNENYQEMLAPQFHVDQQYLEILDSSNQQKLNQQQNSQQGNDHKVRECMIVNLIKIQACVSEDQPQQFVQNWIKRIWILEKDENVRNLLKNKDILEMQKKLFSQNLKSFSSKIKSELQEKLNELQILEQQLSLEGNEDMRKQLQKQINLVYQDMDQYIDNITDLSQQMNINLVFLKEITKELKSIKSKIDLLQQNLNSIAVDVRKLRGKKYDELLQIRKKKILFQAKQNELDSVYIPLKTYEYDPKTGVKVKTPKGNETSLLLVETYSQNITEESLEGEVNEFIWNDTDKGQKDVLLLRGLAGSGKSRSARKIEEFLWKSNELEPKWIPIFISLPSIKSPKFNLIDQALDSDYYNFDSTQIKEFKEAIRLKKERVIFILDSYDEMKQDCIQTNLILTNNFIQEFNIQNNPGKYIKFIITTRSEILNPLGFRTWFYGNSLDNFKDVELIKFDENQIQDYLKKYVELSVKRKIKSLYEFVKQLRGQDLDPEEFQQIWQTVGEIVYECNEQEVSNSFFIFQNKEEEKIVSLLKSQDVFKFIKDQQIITLKKDLQSLWNSKMFQVSISNVNIEQLLTTPFMVEIVVQVLPQLINQESNTMVFKEGFTKKFKSIYKNFLQSNKLIARYQKIEKIQIKNDNQQINKKQMKEDKLNQEVKEIIDQLEKNQFFANYYLADKILFENESIKVNESQYPVGNAVDLVVKALQMKNYTIYQFYECFIELYQEQQIQKFRQLGKISNYESFQIDVLKFSQSLALDLTINQQTQVRYTQKGKIKFQSQYEKYLANTEWEEQYFNDSGQNSEYLKQIRSCSLLITKGAAFSFTHKSIQEFLVAKYIFDLIYHMKLNSKQEIPQQEKESLLLSIYNQDKFNLSNENYLGVISLLKQQLEFDNEIDKKLILSVKLSQKKEYIRTASNSVYLLSNRGTFLGGIEFSNIQLQGTNLYGLSFFGSNFCGSQFSNVVIDGCNFSFCNLYNSSWKDIICKEKPYLRGHDQTVKIVTFSKDGKLLATCESNQIIIWEICTFKEFSRIKEFQAEILCIKFFENNKLITGGIDKILRLWSLEQTQSYDLKLQLEGHYDSIVKILFSNDEKQMYTLDKIGLVIVWNVDYLFEKPQLIGEDNCDIIDMVFTSEGLHFFAIDQGLKRISYYDIKNNTCITHISTNDKKFIKLALSSNDFYLATYDEDKVLFVWDVSTVSNFKLIYYEENIQDIQDITFSPDNLYLTSIGQNIILEREISKMNGSIIQTKFCNCNLLAISDFNDLFCITTNETILFFDILTNEIINSIESEVDKIIFSSKSAEMATQMKKFDQRNKQIRNSLHIEKLDDDQNPQTIQALQFEEDISFACLSYSEQYLLYGLQNGQIFFMKDFNEKPQLYLQLKCDIKQLALSFNDKLLLVLEYDKYYQRKDLSVWNFDSKQKILYIHQFIINSKICFNIDDKSFVFARNSDVIFYDCFTQIEQIKQSHKNNVQDFSLYIEKNLIASIDISSIIIQNLATSQIISSSSFYLSDLECIKFWDSETLLTSSGKFVQIWKIFNNKMVNLQANIVAGNQILHLDCLQNKLKIGIITSNGLEIHNFGQPNIFYFENYKSFRIDISNNQQLAAIRHFDKIKIIQIQGMLQQIELNNDAGAYVLTFSSDDELLASYGYDNNIKIWNLKTQQVLARVTLFSKINKISFFENNTRLICEGSNIIVLDIMNSQSLVVAEAFTVKQKTRIKRFDQLCSIKRNKIASQNKSLNWILRNWKENLYYFFLINETSYLTKISYSKKMFLSTLSLQRSLYILSVKDKKLLKSFQEIETYDISFDEKYIAVKQSGTVQLIEIESNNILSEEGGPEGYKIKILKFANFDILITVSEIEIQVYQIVEQKLNCFRRIVNNENSVFLKYSSLIANLAVSCDSKVKILNFQKSQIKSFFRKINFYHYYYCYLDMAIGIDKNLLLVLSNSTNYEGQGIIILWDIDKFSYLNTINHLNSKQILYLKQNDFVLLDSHQIQCCNFQDFLSENELQLTIMGTSSKKIRCISYISNGSLLASGGEDQKVIVWDIKGRSKIAVFQGHSKSINSLDYSTNSNLIASGGEDTIIRLWNLNVINSFVVYQESHSSQISCLRFSLDGLLLYSSGFDCKIRIWDTIKKRFLNILEENQSKINLFNVLKQYNQDLLISCNCNGDIKIKGIMNKNITSTIVKNINLPISQIIIKEDKLMALQNYQTKDREQSFINFWNINQQEANKIEVVDGIYDYSVSPNTKQLAYFGKEKQLIIIDLQNKISQCLQTNNNSIKLIVFSKDGNKLATITSEFIISIWRQNIDQKWTLSEEVILTNFFRLEESLLSLSFNSCEDAINIVTQDHISSYNLSNKIISEDIFHLQQVSGYSISNKHNVIAVNHKDNQNQQPYEQCYISLYSLEDNLKLIQQFEVNSYAVYSLCFSVNFQYIAAVHSQKFFVWDVKTGNQIFDSQPEKHPIELISFYNNDGIISRTCEYGDYGCAFFFSFWKFQDRFFISLPIQNSIAKISDSGNYMVGEHSLELYIIDPINKKFEVCKIGVSNYCKSASFSPKEDLLAILTNDKSILIWDLKEKAIKNWINLNIDGIIETFINSQILLKTTKNELFIITLDTNFEISQKNFYNPLQVVKHASLTSEGQILAQYSSSLIIIKQNRFAALNKCYFENQIDQVVISQNGILYTKEKETIKLYNMKQNKKVQEVDCKEDTNFYLSPKEQFFIFTEQGKIFFVQIEKIEEYLQAVSFKAHQHSITHVAISQDETLLVTKCEESFIKIWNISDQGKLNLKVILRDQSYEHAERFEFSYDSTLLISQVNEQILIIDINNCQQPESFKHFDFLVYGMANYQQLDGNETLLFVAKNQLFYFNENLKEEVTLVDFTSEVEQFVFSHDAHSLALADKEDTLSMYHIKDLKSKTMPSIQVKSKKEYFSCLTFSFDGQLILSGGLDRSIRLWDSKELKQLAFLDDLSNSVTAVAFSPDGVHFSAGFFDGSVGLYITNTFNNSVKKKWQSLIQVLGESPQIGCLKLFSQHSLLQAQKCRFQDRKKQESDDKSLEALFAQKA